MTPAEQARAGLTALAALATRVGEEQAETIAAIADTYVAALRSGGTLFFAGNGGSAADAQHLATEYVVRYQSTRPALRAVALTTDSSLLTACANDMGFDEVFARQVEALARAGDVVSLHSTSGESPNVIRAAQAAKTRGVTVVRWVYPLPPEPPKFRAPPAPDSQAVPAGPRILKKVTTCGQRCSPTFVMI